MVLGFQGRVVSDNPFFFFTCLAYATCSIGLPLLPTLVANLVLSTRPALVVPWMSVVTFGLFFVFHEYLMDNTGGYWHFFSLDPRIQQHHGLRC